MRRGQCQFFPGIFPSPKALRHIGRQQPLPLHESPPRALPHGHSWSTFMEAAVVHADTTPRPPSTCSSHRRLFKRACWSRPSPALCPQRFCYTQHEDPHSAALRAPVLCRPPSHRPCLHTAAGGSWLFLIPCSSCPGPAIPAHPATAGHQGCL